MIDYIDPVFVLIGIGFLDCLPRPWPRDIARAILYLTSITFVMISLAMTELRQAFPEMDMFILWVPCGNVSLSIILALLLRLIIRWS